MKKPTKRKSTRSDIALDQDVINSVKRRDTIGAMVLEAYEQEYDRALGYPSWAAYCRDTFNGYAQGIPQREAAHAATRRAKNFGTRKINRSVISHDIHGNGLARDGTITALNSNQFLTKL